MVGVITHAHSAIENPQGAAIWRFVAFEQRSRGGRIDLWFVN
jgi:hypothetical protein